MPETDISSIAKKFKDEAVVPFWMWNDRLEKDELVRQLHEIRGHGMSQIIIHPRFGLETPYLSEEWFEMVGCIVDEARKEKMGVWIYDELNWPSGYAGGKVLQEYTGFQAKHLVKNRSGFKVKNTSWKPAYSETHYTDVLNPKAVDAFIGSTYEQYWKRFKEDFGTTILGFFTDEPGFYNNFCGNDPDSIPWTEGLPAFFQAKNGYPLEPSLDLIFQDQGQMSVEARVAFWETVSNLYQESYFKKIQGWCHQKGVALIGHVLVEEDLVNTVKTQGNFFYTMEYLDFAGYDLLNRLEPSALIPAKLADSARKGFGLHGVCAETFGVFGWDLTEKEMQRVASWQAETGLDVMIPHALYYSLRGERFSDCPPSFMAEKFWPKFGKFVEDTRRRLKDRQGEVAEVAIYYPIEAVWGYLSPSESRKAEEINHAFKTASFACYNIGAEFDYLPSPFVSKDLPNYDCLILPKAEILPLGVLKDILKFTQDGGEVICIDGLPQFATRVSQQEQFERLLEEVLSSAHFLSLPKIEETELKFNQLKTKIKSLLSKYIPTIWLARGVRLAKLFGYKKPVSTNQLTGIETRLQEIVFNKRVKNYG